MTPEAIRNRLLELPAELAEAAVRIEAHETEWEAARLGAARAATYLERVQLQALAAAAAL